MRKQYSATYKAEIVRELLKEGKTVSQMASETGIHPTQLKEWNKLALTRLPELFSRNDQALLRYRRIAEPGQGEPGHLLDARREPGRFGQPAGAGCNRGGDWWRICGRR
jgi:transposase-like protein